MHVDYWINWAAELERMKGRPFHHWFAAVLAADAAMDLGRYCPLIITAGKRRNETNIARGSKNQKIGPQGDEEVNIWGVAGEIAIRLALNLSLDEVWNEPQRGEWPKIDGFYKGESYQVKTPTKSYYRWVYNKSIHNLKAELYFLCLPAGNKRIRIVGWLRRNELEEYWYDTDLGYGLVKVIDSNDFRPLSKL